MPILQVKKLRLCVKDRTSVQYTLPHPTAALSAKGGCFLRARWTSIPLPAPRALGKMCLTGSVQHGCFVLQTQPSSLGHPSQGLPGPENFPEVGVSRDQARTTGDAGETLSLRPSGSPPYSEEVQGRGMHGYQPHIPVLP